MIFYGFIVFQNGYAILKGVWYFNCLTVGTSMTFRTKIIELYIVRKYYFPPQYYIEWEEDFEADGRWNKSNKGQIFFSGKSISANYTSRRNT